MFTLTYSLIFLIAVPLLVGSSTAVVSSDKGSNAVLYCNITGEGLTYSWYFGDTLLTDLTNQYLIQGNTLTIYNAQFANSGNYSCTGKNLAGNQTQLHHLQITGKSVYTTRCLYTQWTHL